MARAFQYELRSKSTGGSGWRAYGDPGIELSSEEVRALNDLFSRDLVPPSRLAWLGALQLPSGQWVVAWQRRNEDRLRGVLLDAAAWRKARGDFESIVRQHDERFAQDYLECTDETHWSALPAATWPQFEIGPGGSDYLPLALDYLRKARRAPDLSLRGFATAWDGSAALPEGLAICPFLVVPGGATTWDELTSRLRADGHLLDSTQHTSQDRRSGDPMGHLITLEQRMQDLRQTVGKIASMVSPSADERGATAAPLRVLEERLAGLAGMLKGLHSTLGWSRTVMIAMLGCVVVTGLVIGYAMHGSGLRGLMEDQLRQVVAVRKQAEMELQAAARARQESMTAAGDARNLAMQTDSIRVWAEQSGSNAFFQSTAAASYARTAMVAAVSAQAARDEAQKLAKQAQSAAGRGVATSRSINE